MRAVPQMKVELDGAIVTRPGVLAHMRPQLLPGEILVERVGRIPTIHREALCPA
jgi:hypothetical protein